MDKKDVGLILLVFLVLGPFVEAAYFTSQASGRIELGNPSQAVGN